MSFELVEFCEPAPVPGTPFPGATETVLGTYETEAEAVRHGRSVWRERRRASTHDVVWWIVRVPGETLARWIADASSDVEQIVDLTTHELIAVPYRPQE
ncbi:MAG: hypothetical protein M5U23_07770 [Acidimicrobiia bacterium]|nr:hypothetical protein [Acidimicrobiia bacterium]